MATAHVYVRVQVTGTNDQVGRIQAFVDAIETTVEEAGGEWRGQANVDFDPEPEPVVEDAPTSPADEEKGEG
jgi:hypothetical protein